MIDEPARIEMEIADTRASLHRKLDLLQHRLNPRERMMEAVNSVPRPDPVDYAGAAALAAVGVGTAMALKGLRGRRNGHVEPSAEDMMGE